MNRIGDEIHIFETDTKIETATGMVSFVMPDRMVTRDAEAVARAMMKGAELALARASEASPDSYSHHPIAHWEQISRAKALLDMSGSIMALCTGLEELGVDVSVNERLNDEATVVSDELAPVNVLA